MNKKCKHPGFSRRFISKFQFFGIGFSEVVIKLGIFIQKIGGVLKYEHFWSDHIANNENVQIVSSFTKYKSKHQIWDIAMQSVNDLASSGQILEFGTNNGGSLKYFWSKLSKEYILRGFDCFEGIPEQWDSLPKGAIKGYGFPSELWGNNASILKNIKDEVDRTGNIPKPPQENIIIDKGLFAHSVPRLLEKGVPDDIRLIHFDADIYMGTRPVLDTICGQISYKYYILFDELYSVNHEFKAWTEFVDLFEVNKWKVVAASEDGVQVLIEVN